MQQINSEFTNIMILIIMIIILFYLSHIVLHRAIKVPSIKKQNISIDNPKDIRLSGIRV